VRQDDESKWNHPEAENRQKPQTSPYNEQTADRHAGSARSWQRDACWTHNDVAGGMIDAKALGALFFGVCALVSHPQEMGITKLNTSECHFFEKTAWQIGQAFVLAHSHRGER
jgi:hypothetical protein